jgi:spore coat protein A, manganese oxidase
VRPFSKTRRKILGSLAGAGAGMLLSRRAAGQSDEALPNILAGVRLEPFVDPLPMPEVLQPLPAKSGELFCQLTISELRRKLHRDLPPTVVWGFNGSSPGPMIVAERGRQVTVDWINRLPLRHRLLVDHNLDGAGKDIPEVRSTIHLHGGHVASDSDGYPEDWVTPGHQQRTFYPNRQPAAMLWYHDHSMGITRLNAMMGLAGLYVIRDPEEERLGLPSGRFEIPLVLQDRILDARGRLAYPVGPDENAPWVPEFFGTHILVNGRVSPYLDVEPRPYRFRLLNASNSRVFQLALAPEQPMIQIGSDGGLLRVPVARNEMLLVPGERLDVVVDFRGLEGRRLILVNYGRAPYPSGGAPVPGMVLQFRVGRPLTEPANHRDLPGTLAKVPRIEESAAVKTRRLGLMEVMGANGQMQRMLLDGRRFMDPITEDPVNGTVEIWEFLNTTIDAHPMHLHTVHFQVLDRRPFDVRRQRSTSEVVFTGKAIQAPPEEQGWKDMVLSLPGQLTRIIVPFSGEPGRYVWHCHMLEHEDNEMMRPFLLRA